MMKNKAYYSILIALVVALGGLFSCVSEEFSQGGVKPIPSEGYMKLQINLPDYQTPDVTDEKVSTKAMNEKAENAINTDKLHVLVFNEEADDTTFYYKAPVVDGSLQINPADPSKATVTIKLVKSDTPDTEKYSLLVIANHDLSGVTLDKGVTRKEDVMQSQTFSMPTATGKWNASTGSSTPFPMWGEIKGVKVSEQDMIAPELTLYRALARIDIGLAFKIVDGNITEEAEGLADFKITEVKVYRTFEKGYVSPLLSNPKPGEDGYASSVPEGAVRRTDDAPLSFGPFTQTNSYIREIYVPEATLPDTPSNDNIHCVVIGGYYNGVKGYYRLDFAEDMDQDTRVYLPILRNHRYVFNILNVNGAGFETQEDALKSVPTGTIDYEVIVWDETIHEMHVHGKYYFGLDNREIMLKAKKTADMPDNKFDLKYQTNYPITDVDKITFEWENPTDPSDPSVSPLFEVSLIEGGAKGTIRIEALTYNESNTILSDVLHVRIGSFRIKVIVNQDYINFKYTLNCPSVKVFGTYRPGYDLNPSSSNPNIHRIELSFTAEDASILGSKYEIYTEEINGITFKASGIFTKLTQSVQLIGEGKLDTPLDARTTPFTVKIISNSSSGSYCEATITPVIAKLRVLTIANALMYGYDIGLGGSGSNKLVTSPNNFGPNDNSIVKIEGFEFFRAGNNSHSLGTDATNWLKTGTNIIDDDGITRKYLADILCVGHDGLYFINKAGATIIKEYMANGGVVVMFNEGTIGLENFMQTLIPGAKIASFGNLIRPFVGNEKYKTGTDEEWLQFQMSLLSDPILNGPFGDIRDKQWGEDVGISKAVVSPVLFNNPDIMIYSYAESFVNAKPGTKDSASGFKYETDIDSDNLISLIFFGDGGFTSSNTNGQPYPETGYTLCPLWWNTSTFFPIPKPNYGAANERRDVYNSQVFCNSLAWAVQRSADLFHKREAAMGR